MTTKKELTTSDSLKDHLQAVIPTIFMTEGGKPVHKSITVRFSWDEVIISEATNTRLNASEKQQALESALSSGERATLASLQARVKAAEKALGDKLGASRPKDSRVTVKGITASKA